MIHELREYVALPGREELLHRRFADMTLDLWDKIGLDLVGFWYVDGDPRRIVYMVRFDSVSAAQQHWARFTADARWQRIKEQTEADGPLIESITSTYLQVPDYIKS